MLKHLRMRVDGALLAVLFVALAVRCYQPGLTPLVWDEVNLLFWADRIARFGEIIWLSNNPITRLADWIPLTHHSPLNNYMLALPYLIAQDARLARVFVQLLGVASVLIVYVMLRRYFGVKAAVIGGLWFALLPTAVFYSRFVWNPNLAQPFIASYLLTGLLGYHEGKGWARVLHWLCLGIAAQNHPANALLVLPSLALVAAAALTALPARRRTMVLHTVLGIVLTSVTYFPWMLGTFGGAAFRGGIMFEVGSSDPASATVREMAGGGDILSSAASQFSRLMSATSFEMSQRGAVLMDDSLAYPPVALDGILSLHSANAGLVCMWALVYGLRRPAARLPWLFLALVVWLPLLVANVLTTELQDFYVFSLTFAGTALTGAAVSRLERWKRVGHAMMVFVTGVVAGLFMWLNIGSFHAQKVIGWDQRFRAPLDTFVDVADSWARDSGQAVFLVEALDEKYFTVDMQRYFWSVVGGDAPIRVVDRMAGSGIPIAPEGTLLVSVVEGRTIPDLFGGGDPFGFAPSDPTRPYFQQQFVALSLPDVWDYAPSAEDRFDNGVHILGLDRPESLAGDTAWSGRLYWEPTHGVPAQDYQFSLRLVTAQGETVAQRDFPSLERGLWRAGETVVSPVTIALSQPLAPAQTLRVQLIMYTLPTVQNASAVDEQGKPVGEWLFLDPVQARES